MNNDHNKIRRDADIAVAVELVPVPGAMRPGAFDAGPRPAAHA